MELRNLSKSSREFYNGTLRKMEKCYRPERAGRGITCRNYLQSEKLLGFPVISKRKNVIFSQNNRDLFINLLHYNSYYNSYNIIIIIVIILL